MSEPYFAIASAYGMRRNGVGTCDADLLEHLDDERLDEAEDQVDVRERDLDVHLRELGLPVGAQVLVAEALHDLEVAVGAGDHQDLLEDLRRLRQREELARDGRGSAPGSRAPPRAWTCPESASRSPRSPRASKYLRIAIVTRCRRPQVVLQARTAQVEIAIPQPHVLADVGVRRRSGTAASSPRSAGGSRARRPRPRRYRASRSPCRRRDAAPAPGRRRRTRSAASWRRPSTRCRWAPSPASAPWRSRTSRNSRPPRSRTRWIQPSRTTSAPTSPRRSAPQVWVRDREPRESDIRIDECRLRGLRIDDYADCRRRLEPSRRRRLRGTGVCSPVVQVLHRHRRRAPRSSSPTMVTKRTPRLEAYFICLPILSASGYTSTRRPAARSVAPAPACRRRASAFQIVARTSAPARVTCRREHAALGHHHENALQAEREAAGRAPTRSRTSRPGCRSGRRRRGCQMPSTAISKIAPV